MVAIQKELKDLEKDLVMLSPVKATSELLNLVHPNRHIQNIEKCAKNSTDIDADTIISDMSYEVALRAVGAGMVAVDSILKMI